MIKVRSATKNPIQYLGGVAGVCYNSIDNPASNYNRGGNCIEDDHGRTMEWPDVSIDIDGYSNRMIRELYTTIIGVSRLQQSTRYVNMEKRFEEYYIPPKIRNNKESLEVYEKAMKNLKESYEALLECGIPKEDAGNLVPLGQHTTIALKINLRALMNLFEVRTCTRAYIEYREFMRELREVLIGIDSEWKEIVETYFMTKCEKAGYCTESKSCGRYPHKKDIKIVLK